MSAPKVIGGILIAISVPVLVAGVLLAFGDESSVPSWLSANLVGGSRETTGYAYAGAGLFVLVIGIILLLLPARKKEFTAVVAPQPVQQVEIKRTNMNLGTPGSTAALELDSELEAVNQRIGRLKVQFGMGEISSESYTRLMTQYEGERAAIERRILESRG